ncbi:hypothetical protein [Alicyclobacillus tolerans]|uniref:Uncharacterized protein n=1 Tax=Alicyclobacillus tolerans TaxID=90970 RepID=A0ABT9LZG5_9BACL|nr:hypothetical protein [Alicyclobacillus tengchongensis]MDP9729675.1 hypothetical protein [Alicyclobacillus tengchongensis]
MEEVRIVQVVHQEDAPEESVRWIRRLITKFLVEQAKASPKDIGMLLKEIDSKPS